jgi:hypothetical protein
MPEKMPVDIAESMPGRMPEDMPDRMPEDMSDRMPEDLPVKKCINVMVGITRSKVMCFPVSWAPGGKLRPDKHPLVSTISTPPHFILAF